MTQTIQERLETLAALQQADSDGFTIEQELAGVESRMAALETQLDSFRKQVLDAQEQLEAVRKSYRANEDEVKSIEDRVARNDEKLRSVKTNKEYQSMLREIDDLKVKKTALEDQMMNMLEQLERAEKEVLSLKADLTDMQKEIEAQQQQIQGEADAQRAQMEALVKKRETIWAQLDPKLQKMYSRAKQQGRGVAVAAVEDAVCLVCRMNLPPQRFIELMRMSDMQMCPHYQRIIYPKAMIDDI